MQACEILPRILIDNLDTFKHTLNSNVDAYHQAVLDTVHVTSVAQSQARLATVMAASSAHAL